MLQSPTTRDVALSIAKTLEQKTEMEPRPGKHEKGSKNFVSHVHIHPDYDNHKKDNDIALLKLKICLSFNKNVQPACLPESLDFTGANALFSGWGRVVGKSTIDIV